MAQAAEVVERSGPFEVVCDVSDEKAWLKQRLTGFGASEAAAICEESRWSSPYSIWARKCGLLPEQDENEPMTWGKLLEPVILAEYSRRTKRPARPSGLLLRSLEHPWALATLDGETWLPANDANKWPLEIKTSSAWLADEWADGPPRSYVLQMQQQMLVTGAKRATGACLLGGQRFVWCDVERDETDINKIIARGDELWKRVQSREPPPVDGSEATSEALKEIFAKDTGEIVFLGGELIDVADELAAIKAAAKEAEARQTLLENTIKTAIGNATRGILPDGRGFTFGLQKRASYVAKACEFRVLRAVKTKGKEAL